MANPQERARTEPSAVASCTATDCSYNEERECHAGEIQVQIGANGAICATYNPQKSKPRP